MSTQAQKPDLTKLTAYGDTLNDGVVQLNFVLPVEPSPEAQEAAAELLRKQGFRDPKIAYMDRAGEGYAYFVAYASFTTTVDITRIEVPKIEFKGKSMKEIDEIIKTKIGKKLVVLGATIGTDAHTVGIDAIFNMKGWAGDYGLERYHGFEAQNLGAQVDIEELIRLAHEKKADAICVSQVVTQKESHIINFRGLKNRLLKDDLEKDLIVVIGGPRVNQQLALELGFQAGFGPGTTPSHVASFIVDEYLRRKKI